MAYQEVANAVLQETYVNALQSVADVLQIADDLVSFLYNTFDSMTPRGRQIQIEYLQHVFEPVLHTLIQVQHHLRERYERTD